MNAETFSGLWYLNEPFAQRMEGMILPRLAQGKEPIPSHFKLRTAINLVDENGNFNENAWYLQKYLRAGGGQVAVIPVNGSMSRYGFCNLGNDQIGAIIREAEKHADVKGIVLNIDTPGGTVDSTDVLADTIKAFSKPIVAWTPYCASAGYFIASQCDRIVMENSLGSSIGSIGVLMVYIDQKEAYEKVGYKVTIFRAEGSEDKARINGIEELTEELVAEIEADLKTARVAFHGYVRRGRAGLLTTDDVLTGKMYSPKEAKKFGLIDQFGSLEDAVRITLKL